MIDVIKDGLIDTVKIIPYLFITFVILELFEHNIKTEKILKNNKKCGPLIGGIFGAFPQCGFSAMASNLFSSRVITVGTLVAVFLSTSDEMIPIMLSENTNILLLFKIVGFKVLLGIVFGYLIDLIYKRKLEDNIHHMCEEDHCNCDKHGVFLSSIIHTLKIGLFILIMNLLINITIYKIGEDNLSNILLSKNIFKYFCSSLIGLIPNCASSVILTELFLSKLISLGCLMSGLLTGSGLGILLLFKTNNNFKENIFILSFIYFIGVIVGILVDIIL